MRRRGVAAAALSLPLVLLLVLALCGAPAAGGESPEPTATSAPRSAAADAPSGLKGWLSQSMPQWLRQKAVLLEHWQWLGLLLLIALGMIAGRLASLLISGWVRRLTKRKTIDVPEKLRGNIGRPFGIIAMAVVWRILLPALTLPESTFKVLNVAVEVLLAAGGVWAAYRFVDVLSGYFQVLAGKTETKLDDLLVPMIRKTLKVFATAFALVFVAQNLDIKVQSLLAGLGLGGLAFAFAAKDVVGNFFGSLAILIDRPFHIGDWIVVGDAEGTVEEVGFRSTRIRTFYNSVVSVPNGSLAVTAVDNLGARTYRRIKTMISLTYSTPPKKIEAFCEGIRELIRLHPYTRKDYFHVYFNQYAASSLDILLYCFLRTPGWATELRERHRLFVDIQRLAARLGVEFAFPTQTIHVESLPARGEAAETEFVPETPGEQAKLSGADAEKALELGRREAAAIVASTLGTEGEKPPPVVFPPASPA